MIKKILKYGTVAAVSFELGTIVQTHYLNYKAKGKKPDNNEDLVWKGETGKLKMPVVMAEDTVENLDDVIESSNYSDALFAEDDLRNVRTKLVHAISEVKDDDDDFITFELSDRERLRYIDETFLMDGAYAFKPKEY